MKAAVFTKPGEIQIQQVPVPEISDDELLIKVKYTGVCGTDWSIYTGKYSSDKLPMIAGHEFSGVVAKAGKNAVGFKEGDRVTADINQSCGHCFYCKRGQKLMCREFSQLGIHMDGTYAEYAKTPWELAHKLPGNLDFMTGAFIEPVSCVIHSAKEMNLQMGSSVAIIGCGLGILHAAAAHYRGGAPVIVIGHNDKRMNAAREAGADILIDIDKVDDPVVEVKKLTEGRGADYVVESVGKPETYTQAFQMVRPGGTVAAFGITAEEDTIPLRPFDLVLGEKKVTGSCAGVGNDWTDAIALLQYGRIRPQNMFSLAVPLEQLEETLKEMQGNRDLIKVFVSPELSERKVPDQS